MAEKAEAMIIAMSTAGPDTRAMAGLLPPKEI